MAFARSVSRGKVVKPQAGKAFRADSNARVIAGISALNSSELSPLSSPIARERTLV